MTFSPDNVEAAVFDIGGVFSYPDFEPVAAELDSLGVDQPDDVMAFRRAHHAGVRALTDAERPTREDQADFWALYDAAYAATLSVPLDELERFRVAVRVGWNWVHEPNVAAFHRLAATGLPLAIVSNNDGTAPEQMTEFGVCQVGPGPLPEVAAIVDSTLLGIAKPNPAIFSPALDALGILPDKVVYVGDTVHADVMGAANAGMQAVQLDPFGHHGDFSHTTMIDLDEFVTALA